MSEENKKADINEVFAMVSQSGQRIRVNDDQGNTIVGIIPVEEIEILEQLDKDLAEWEAEQESVVEQTEEGA